MSDRFGIAGSERRVDDFWDETKKKKHSIKIITKIYMDISLQHDCVRRLLFQLGLKMRLKIKAPLTHETGGSGYRQVRAVIVGVTDWQLLQ